jgi:hypothetical protein
MIGNTGPAGPTGATGATGPRGANGSSLIEHVSSFSQNSSAMLVMNGSPIALNGAPVFWGDAVLQTSPDTVIISVPGEYLVLFTALITGSGFTSGVQLQLNKTPVGPKVLQMNGMIVLHTVISVSSAPSTLQVVATGASFTLLSGNSATLTIMRLV